MFAWPGWARLDFSEMAAQGGGADQKEMDPCRPLASTCVCVTYTVAVYCQMCLYCIAEAVHEQVRYVEFRYITLGDLLIRSCSISENCKAIRVHCYLSVTELFGSGDYRQ